MGTIGEHHGSRATTIRRCRVEITVSRRNTEVSEALRMATVEKIGRLSRFLDGMERAEVHFFEERNPRIADREVCEVTMEGHGHHVRAKVAAPDGFVAVDRAVEKLEHQLHKLKTKLVRRHHPIGRGPAAGTLTGRPGAVDGADADDDDDVRPGRPRIVKAKRFEIKPMTAEEAALQMDLLNHGFYFFTNSETNRAAVVYRRSDGDVGLIDEAD
jgi:putative sigma-54 modulation protein